MNNEKQFVRRSWLIDAAVNNFNAKAEDEADNYAELVRAWGEDDDYDSSIKDQPVKFNLIEHAFLIEDASRKTDGAK